MEERYIEIKFYYYIQKLIRLFNFHVSVLDMLDSLIELSGCNKSIIKNLIAQVRNNTGILRVYGQEAVYVMTKLNKSYREIARLTTLSKTTINKYAKELDYDHSMYIGMTKKLSDKEYKEVETFVKTIEKVVNILT